MVIQVDKKSIKSYVNLAIFRVLQNQLELAGSTCQVSEIELQTVSENMEWIAEGFFLALGQQCNHNIGNYQNILTQTRTFEYLNLVFYLELQDWYSGVDVLTLRT